MYEYVHKNHVNFLLEKRQHLIRSRKKSDLKRKWDLQNVCHLGMSSIMSTGTMNNGTIMEYITISVTIYSGAHVSMTYLDDLWIPFSFQIIYFS